jgi:peptidoglycan hydrolase-like protein with peptidoglycan-binding domain
MTIKQRQHLLAYLGYYVGAVDGDWGTLSKTACTAFQKDFGGINVDGFGGTETDKALCQSVAYGMPAKKVDKSEKEDITGTFWDEIEYFTREEFRCQCKGKYCNGFPVEPQEKLVRTVNEIRRRLGVPVTIVESGGSGVRCEIHNRNVGGVENSDHKTGNAADLHSDKSPEEMARVAEEVMGNTGQIGIYSWGIHVGINPVYSRFYG